MFTCIERKMCSLIHKVKILLRKCRMKAFSVLPFFPTSTIPANTLIRTIIDLNKNLNIPPCGIFYVSNSYLCTFFFKLPPSGDESHTRNTQHIN